MNKDNNKIVNKDNNKIMNEDNNKIVNEDNNKIVNEDNNVNDNDNDNNNDNDNESDDDYDSNDDYDSDNGDEHAVKQINNNFKKIDETKSFEDQIDILKKIPWLNNYWHIEYYDTSAKLADELINTTSKE